MKKISIYFLLFISLFLLISCDKKEETNKESEASKTQEEIKKEENEVVGIDNVELDQSNFDINNLDSIVLTGKIFIKYANGEIKEEALTSEMYTIDQEKLDRGSNNIKIKYTSNGKEFSYDAYINLIEVIAEDDPVSISNAKVKKTVFTDGDEIVLEGTCVITRESGAQEIFNFTSADVTLPSLVIIGDNTATISFKEHDITLSLDITFKVVEKTSDDESLANEIIDYLNSLYLNYEVTESIKFVSEYKGVSIDFESKNTKLLSHGGKFYQPILDEEFQISYFFFIGNTDYEGTITMIAKGYGDKVDATFVDLDYIVPNKAYTDLTLITYYEKYNAKIIWLDTEGMVYVDGKISVPKKGDDYEITVVARVTCDGISKEQQFVIKCMMLTDIQKVNKVVDYYTDLFNDTVISEDFPLPTVDEHYGCKLNWYSYNPDMLTDSGEFHMPLFDININFFLTVSLGNEVERKIMTVKLKGKEFNDTWEKVDELLNRIHKDVIETQKYTLYGSESGYYYVTAYNEGYVPFYTTNELTVIKDLLPNGTNLKPDLKRQYTYFITLHNTGMAAPSATAKGLNDYIHSTDRQASWHFAIDDKEAYNHVAVDEVAWHAGDGGRTVNQIWYSESYRSYGIGGGNYFSVGIEMCVNSGGDFNWTMRNTAKLVSKLLVQYNLNPSRIRQHFDYSGKDCPQVLRHADRWDEMLELISMEYFARTQLKGVEFEWTSLNPEIMDNTGKVINNPKVDTEISYKVKVTYNGESREFTFTSLLQKSKK